MSNIEKKDYPENIIRRIKETIQKGKFGIDFTISKREKNEYLKQQYNINDDKIIEIMMDLETKDFIKKEKSNNLLHPEDIIYVHDFTTFINDTLAVELAVLRHS